MRSAIARAAGVRVRRTRNRCRRNLKIYFEIYPVPEKKIDMPSILPWFRYIKTAIIYYEISIEKKKNTFIRTIQVNCTAWGSRTKVVCGREVGWGFKPYTKLYAVLNYLYDVMLNLENHCFFLA